MSDISIKYGNKDIAFKLPKQNLAAILCPNKHSECEDSAAEIERALNHPIGCETLEEIIKPDSRILIISDDNTRLTPVRDIIPAIIKRAEAVGVKAESITVLIALGTHRPMTDEEIYEKFGEYVVSKVKIVNHEFRNLDKLHDLGVTSNGTPVFVNKSLLEHDVIIGVGSIVPHHIPGFSGGAKIIQPGVCGEETTAQTHLLSVRSSRSMLGKEENPVRAELELIARKVNAKYVFNAVLNEEGKLIKGFFGNTEDAFREGVKLSRQVYGVKTSARTPIVVASSFPCDLEFWQAHKTLYACEAVVEEGGTIIIATPCPEGVAVTHSDMVNFTCQSPEEIDRQIKDGTIKDKVAGALALAWSKIRCFATVCIVSGGIDEETAGKLGFLHFDTVQDAVSYALDKHGESAGVTVLPFGGDILPIVED